MAPWSTKIPNRLKQMKLRAAIYQCENLPPADSNGTSDPYVQLYSRDEVVSKTHNCEDTNNPLFFSVCEIQMGIDTLDTATPVVLNIWDVDSDLLDSTDDFIGRSLIFLDSPEVRACTSNSDQVLEPKWFPVKKSWASWNSQNKEDEEEDNIPQILVSFQLVDYEYNFQIPAKSIDLADKEFKIGQGKIYPMPHIHYKEFKCDIMVLGLRSLVSTGLLPVRKAFVKFNLKSVLPLSMAKAVENVQTLPKEGGSNPNINTVIQFEIKIPDNPLFCPSMSCDAFDHLYFDGMAQPHIGTFTLKLGKIIEDNKEETADMI